jgi:succinate dehydrogenase/fumarate reductase cytochrome b subunit
MGLARFSTLFLALLIASPALYSAFVTKELDPTTALLRYLIAVPVAAIMLAAVRAVTRDFGQNQEHDAKDKKDATVRVEAIAGEPMARRSTDTAPSTSPSADHSVDA